MTSSVHYADWLKRVLIKESKQSRFGGVKKQAANWGSYQEP